MLTSAEWTILLLSLRVSLVAVIVMLVPGVFCGWLLARKRFPGKIVLDALVHLPLVLPPVVVGYVLLLALGRQGWIGGFLHDRLGVDVAFTWKAAALAAGVMGFPVARPCGASGHRDGGCSDRGCRPGHLALRRGRVLTTITLPLALPGILAGVVMAFARSLGEFGATITFAGNIEGVTRTLPVAIYTQTQVPGGDAAAIRLVVISIIVSLAAMIASELLARRITRRIGAAS